MSSPPALRSLPDGPNVIVGDVVRLGCVAGESEVAPDNMTTVTRSIEGTSRMRKAIMVSDAAKPGGHYSHAVIANEMVYVSGQVPRDPTTGLTPNGFADQVRLAMRNVERILRGVGLDLTDVVKITGYLTDLARFKEYNEIYREFFPTEPPARTTIGCQLVGVEVEIDCIAVKRT